MLSPIILKWSWGKIKVDQLGEYKDVKLYPGGGKGWDWNETGTQHSPGIQIADIEDLIENGSEIVILSQGYFGRLKVSADALNYIKYRNVSYFILKTEKAIQKYNELCLTKNVGGLFHSTC